MSDSVEVSVTHEIKIDGEKSWIGARYTTDVSKDETVQDAYDRAGKVVDESVLQQIKSTVRAVQRFTK